MVDGWDLVSYNTCMYVCMYVWYKVYMYAYIHIFIFARKNIIYSLTPYYYHFYTISTTGPARRASTCNTDYQCHNSTNLLRLYF
jgi:hypothetical protein